MSGRVVILLLLGLAIQGAGLVLHIVGLATPVWSAIESDVPGTEAHFGLWKYCINGKCDDNEDVTKGGATNLKAAKAFAILGMLMAAAAAALACLNFLLTLQNKSSFKIMSLASLVASVIAFPAIEVCAAIWATVNYIPGFTTLGYSFGLSLLASLLLPLGGLFGFLGSWQAPA
jgi:hypothetical protein